jgi:GxxExxY protein
MSDHALLEETLTRSVIGAFYAVYNTLGFGFLEQVYLSALEREVLARGHAVGREVYVPVCYKGELISRQRIDMIVDERLVIEAKSTQDLHKSAARQVYNYLRATHLEVGLLLHFGPDPAFYRLVYTAREQLRQRAFSDDTNTRALRRE